MRLSELDPRWYSVEGKRVGFTFNCPHCPAADIHRLAVAVHQDGLVDPEPDNKKQLAAGYVWEMKGGESFETVTLTPSVDASKSGHWHGLIVNGEVR